VRARLLGMLAVGILTAACEKAPVDEGPAKAGSAKAEPAKAEPAKAEPAKAAAATGKGQVLVILSSANKLPLKEGKEYATGYFLNELMVPVKAMISAGFTPVFANPAGNPPVMDEHSDSKDFFNDDPKALAAIKELRDGIATYKSPRKVADVVREGLDGYIGVFFPGGHAPMGDLLKDTDVGAVLQHFHAKGKPTGMICHGPVSLLAAAKEPAALVEAIAAGNVAEQKRLAAGWPYAGYRVAVFTRAEEQTAEQGGKAGFLKGYVRFYPDDALRAAGATVDVAAPFQSHVVRDRELITGQQPKSDDAFAVQYLAALEEAATAKTALTK
jgi:putative intracellular protease/amidase